MINFYHRLDNSFFACLLSSWTKVKDLAEYVAEIFRVAQNDRSVCLFSWFIPSVFFCSVCRIVCVSVDIWLNIRGYLITYPWIFHYASTVTRSFCFALAVNCLHGVGFSHIAIFCFYSHKSHRSHEIFFHRWIFLSRESRESREVFFHRWFWSHTDLTNLTKAYIAYARMYHPAENTRRSRQARAKRRAICEIREICVR